MAGAVCLWCAGRWGSSGFRCGGLRRQDFPRSRWKRPAARGGVVHILRDRRIWGLAAANALVMTVYTLWTNWTTLYFVEQHHLTEIQANEHFAWIPPVFATLGGFAGGWMAFRTIRHGSDVLRARLRICWLAAAVLLLTAAVPLMPTPALAAALISFSFFWCLAISTNLYAMPIDFFGAGHAAFGVSILTASYGLMQTVLSPLIGSMVDHFGFHDGLRCAVGDAAGGDRDSESEYAMTLRAATRG